MVQPLTRQWMEDAPAVTRSPRVLLAEDDGELRRFLAEVLRGDGFEVIECSHGADLVEELGEVPDGGGVLPDLIVTDLRMPGVTGMSVLAGLHDVGWAVPVILMTAFADPATIEQAERLGASYVLAKPFQVAELLVAAREAIESR